nr:lactococcin 972 family bacteriocin [Catenibacterium mitsuokai]
MLNKKFLFTTLAAVSMATSMMLATPVMAATNDAGDKDAQNGIVKTTYEDKNGTWTEGMIGGNPEGVETCWLANGPKRQYPSEGGTWEYGFWHAKVRSYYTVKRCHGSTVKLDSKTSRSVNTASGKKSIAELWAIQSNSKDRYFYRVCR